MRFIINRKEISKLFSAGWLSRYFIRFTSAREIIFVAVMSILLIAGQRLFQLKTVSSGRNVKAMITEVLSRLFQSYTGECPEKTEAFPASGSNRNYFRLSSMHFSCVGVCGTSPEENRAFVAMAGHFKAKGLPVPEVYACSEDGLCYLQEDLGNTLLFDLLAKGRETGEYGADERELLKKTMRLLPAIQYEGAEGFDFDCCYPQPAFNRRSVLWDLNYFKYCFLKPVGTDFQEDRLEDDFERMADVLLSEPSDTFMYRDFQSRNVMIKEENPWLIDFQGGRKGPVYYDVASFLWQARTAYPEELRQELLSEYIKALQNFAPVNEQHFKNRLKHFVLFRTLQVLGAYGFRGYFEKKSHFIQSVPPAVDNLKKLLQEGFPEYPYLSRVLTEMTGEERFKEKAPRRELEVKVYSFSYKKGIPEDDSGNGGGFVFDCRAPHNPGKYDAYKKLTGLDEPVIRFLEEDGELPRFLESVYSLVDASVSRYLERGFTDLMVCFGCTGGQHRSVYAAQHLAEHLYKKYGVKVYLTHREQGIKQIMEVV